MVSLKGCRARFLNTLSSTICKCRVRDRKGLPSTFTVSDSKVSRVGEGDFVRVLAYMAFFKIYI
jgi:hypothetical protein